MHSEHRYNAKRQYANVPISDGGPHHRRRHFDHVGRAGPVFEIRNPLSVRINVIGEKDLAPWCLLAGRRREPPPMRIVSGPS